MAKLPVTTWLYFHFNGRRYRHKRDGSRLMVERPNGKWRTSYDQHATWEMHQRLNDLDRNQDNDPHGAGTAPTTHRRTS